MLESLLATALKVILITFVQLVKKQLFEKLITLRHYDEAKILLILVATCEIPTAPFNGDIKPIRSGRVPFNTIIKFECNVGYKKIGQSSSRCQTDGSWTNAVPSCSGESTLKLDRIRLTDD